MRTYTVTELIDDNTCRARANDDGRAVVIERVPPAAQNEMFAHCLTQLRPVIGLRHANIVESVALARDQRGVCFIVTEDVEGCSLHALVERRGRVQEDHALHVMIECCAGLAFALARGIGHGAVSPRTICLATNGDVKLADLGRSWFRLVEHREPSPGAHSYMAWETASGEDTDDRVDVWACGVVLWELLAGRRLFLGANDFDTLDLVRAAEFPHIEGLDPSLDAIVRQALATDVTARYQTPGELGDALSRYAVSRSIRLTGAELGARVADVHRELVRTRVAKDDRRALDDLQADVDGMVAMDKPI